jgi:hypothetical protein
MESNQQKYNEDKQILEKWQSRLKLSGILVSFEYNEDYEMHDYEIPRLFPAPDKGSVEKYSSTPWKVTDYRLIEGQTITITPPRLKHNVVTISTDLIKRLSNGVIYKNKDITIDLTSQSYADSEIDFNESEEYINMTIFKSLQAQASFNKQLRIWNEIEMSYELITADICNTNFTSIIDMNSLSKTIRSLLDNPVFAYFNIQIIMQYAIMKIGYAISKHLSDAVNIDDVTASNNYCKPVIEKNFTETYKIIQAIYKTLLSIDLNLKDNYTPNMSKDDPNFDRLTRAHITDTYISNIPKVNSAFEKIRKTYVTDEYLMGINNRLKEIMDIIDKKLVSYNSKTKVLGLSKNATNKIMQLNLDLQAYIQTLAIKVPDLVKLGVIKWEQSTDWYED